MSILLPVVSWGHAEIGIGPGGISTLPFRARAVPAIGWSTPDHAINGEPLVAAWFLLNRANL